MNKEKFRVLLERLDKELEGADITDAETRQKLSQLIADVKMKLNNPEDKQHHYRVVDNLKDSALKLETHHPKLTGILNEISNYLSSLGI